MKYRGQEFLYEQDNFEIDTEAIRQQELAKSYSHKRPLRTSRRRKVKSASSHPGCGMGGRRNHRWSW